MDRTVDELRRTICAAHWPAIREQLLAGRYQPSVVKRVEIPKPDGGVRLLGIPTVLDRFIQQAVLQVLQPHDRSHVLRVLQLRLSAGPERARRHSVRRNGTCRAVGAGWSMWIWRSSLTASTTTRLMGKLAHTDRGPSEC